MRMQTMRKIDWYIGIPICYFLSVWEIFKRIFYSKKNREIKKILIIKFLGIGSIVLILPAIQALKDKFPNARIYFLTFFSNKEILEIINLTDKNYYIDTSSISKFIFSAFKIIYQLRKENIDISLDFEFFAKFPLVLASLIGVRKKAGFYLILEWWRKYLLDYHGYYNHYYHVKDIFLSLVYLVVEHDLYYIKFGEYIAKYSLSRREVSSENTEFIKQKLRDFGWSEQKIILINPNAGAELAPHLKRWPQDSFSELIKKIDEFYNNLFFIIVGSKSEQNYVQEIVNSLVSLNLSNQVVNFAGQTSLKELSFLFKISSLFITIDSGPMHLASLFNIPIIGLFGAETPILYGPLNEKAVVLYKQLYCVPMFTVYNGKQTELTSNIPLQLITVDSVFNKVEQVLNSQH